MVRLRYIVGCILIGGLLLIGGFQLLPHLDAETYTGTVPDAIETNGEVDESKLRTENSIFSPVTEHGHIEDRIRMIDHVETGEATAAPKFIATVQYGTPGNYSLTWTNGNASGHSYQIGNKTYWKNTVSSNVTELGVSKTGPCEKHCLRDYVIPVWFSPTHVTEFAAVETIESSHSHGDLTRLKLVGVDLSARTTGFFSEQFGKVRILTASGYIDVDSNGRIWNADLSFTLLRSYRGTHQLSTVTFERTHDPSITITHPSWQSRTQFVSVESVDKDTFKVTNTGQEPLSNGTTVKFQSYYPDTNVFVSTSIGELAPGESVYITVTKRDTGRKLVVGPKEMDGSGDIAYVSNAAGELYVIGDIRQQHFLLPDAFNETNTSSSESAT